MPDPTTAATGEEPTKTGKSFTNCSAEYRQKGLVIKYATLDEKDSTAKIDHIVMMIEFRP